MTEGSEFVVEEAVIRNAEGGVSLVGSRCQCCGTKTIPRSDVCHVCMSETMVRFVLEGEGRLYSYTVLHVGRPGWRRPLALGYVDFDDNVRVFGPLTGDLQALCPDIAVRLTEIEIGTDEDGQVLRNFAFAAPETS